MRKTADCFCYTPQFSRIFLTSSSDSVDLERTSGGVRSASCSIHPLLQYQAHMSPHHHHYRTSTPANKHPLASILCPFCYQWCHLSLKAAFSQAAPANSWFRESHKAYWRPDLLSWDKTHSGGLAPQDRDVSMETITLAQNLQQRCTALFQQQKVLV